MIRAFFAGKSAGKNGDETAAGVWCGYREGTLMSCYILWAEMVVILAFSLLDGVDEALSVLGGSIILCLVYILFTTLVGLILYTAPSFFGFGIGKQVYVAKLIAKDASKTRQEIERELRVKQSAKAQLR